MLNGIVLGKNIWDVDVTYSKFWNSKGFGVNLQRTLVAPKEMYGIKDTNKYQFVIATDLWTITARKALQHARDIGMKIFFLPREAFNFFDEFLFEDKRFLHKGEYYFRPDVVFAPGEKYGCKWQGKASVYVTGHPRFDYCLYDDWVTKNKPETEFGILEHKKTFFFPSYTIFDSKNFEKETEFKQWGTIFKDVFDEREALIKTLIDFSASRDDVQVITKLHPMSSAALRKKGETADIKGLTLKYLKNPTEHFRVIDGKNQTRRCARDLLTSIDFVVGTNSTMMFEGAVLGKPVLRSIMGISGNLFTMPGYSDVFVESLGVADTLLKLNQMADRPQDFTAANMDEYARIDTGVCERVCRAIKAEMVAK